MALNTDRALVVPSVRADEVRRDCADTGLSWRRRDNQAVLGFYCLFYRPARLQCQFGFMAG